MLMMTSLKLYDGEFVCHRAPDGDLLVVVADPRIFISAELVDQSHSPGLEREVSVQHEPATCPTGDVWTIDAVNRRVVYRVGRYLPDRHAYEAEWPD